MARYSEGQGFNVGFEIIESPQVGKLVTPALPARLVNYRGPWKQRRIRQWRRRHPAYREPTGEYIRNGSTILCHPTDAARLYEIAHVIYLSTRRGLGLPHDL